MLHPLQSSICALMYYIIIIISIELNCFRDFCGPHCALDSCVNIRITIVHREEGEMRSVLCVAERRKVHRMDVLGIMLYTSVGTCVEAGVVPIVDRCDRFHLRIVGLHQISAFHVREGGKISIHVNC